MGFTRNGKKGLQTGGLPEAIEPLGRGCLARADQLLLWALEPELEQELIADPAEMALQDNPLEA